MTNFKYNVAWIVMSENIFKMMDRIHDPSIHNLVAIPKIQVSKKTASIIKLKDNCFYFSQSHSCKFLACFNWKVTHSRKISNKNI